MILGLLLAAGLGLNAGVQDSDCMPGQPAEEHPVERMREARLIHHEPPDFPETALRQGIKEATVFIQVLIDLHGRVKHPHVLQCSHAGLGFETAALKAVKRWRYEPAEMNGDTIEVYQTVEVKFDAATSPPSLAVLISPPSRAKVLEEASSRR